ncbi:TPM domain-containing protein [Serinicoccus chungangensis]|uniref:TPM domain-containing protein n=1 Tax=Serinicoccus chungangensis TaxID=767452 RepID=UPI00128F55DD|nr:TPM domain-containing protein [Serinicoccus chungangensis]
MSHSTPRSRTLRPGAAGLLAVGAALALAPAVAGSAAAEQPSYLEDAVHDPADVLSDAEEAAATEQIEALREETGLQLFVAYVDTFEDSSGATVGGEEWATLTAEESEMGTGDLLLAVAVDQRAYGVGDAGGTLSPEQVETVQLQDIEPRLAEDDWAGAVEGATEGFAREYADASSGGGAGVPDGDQVQPTSSGGLGGAFPLLFFAPLVVGGVAMAVRSRQRRRPDPGAPVPPHAQGRSLPELHREAAEALVGMDDAVRSAGEELDFARAQFGTQRTEAFGAALERARQAAREAFSLRQQLDDDTEEPESVQRGMLGRILDLTGTARAELDARTQEFARLRSLQDRAPQFLAELATRARETRERLPAAEQELRGLAARHPAAALATVRGNLAQATNLLDSADGFVTAGRQSLERDDRASAVAAARAAEESVGQAATLLDQVSTADAELRGAGEAITAGIASLSADLQDARRLGAGEPTVAQAVQRARAAIEQAQTSRDGGDPLRALAELDAAEHDLDALLEPLRESDRHQTKLRGDFEARVSRVGARLRSIDQTVATRRGAVSSGPRTRISEALRLYDDAVAQAAESPTAAMQLLTRAEQLGEQALTEAQRDADQWGGPGGFGGPTSGRGHRGIDPWSLVLGGILSGMGSSHRHSGGWGGGGSFGGGGGGFGGGSFGGGSFGGGGGGGTFSGGRF